MALHLGWGVLRLAGSGLEKGGVDWEPFVGILAEMGSQLEGEGGSLSLAQGPVALMRRAGSSRAKGGEERLMAGLKREFDPQGILPSSRWEG